MRKLIPSVICFLFLFIIPALFARDPSPTTHFYIIEYKKPVQGSGNVGTLHVIFYVKIEPAQTEAFVKSELQRLVQFFSPRSDIMATAWYSQGDRSTERMIKLTDGSNHLIYDLKTGKILSTVQMWGPGPPPLPLKKR